MNSKKNDKPVTSCGSQKQCALATNLLDLYLQDCQKRPPPSPALSTSSDSTLFEPSIDMLVNDFDDEETLNAQEAMEHRQKEDYENEIETLQKESEMPLEELLAKYRNAKMPQKRKKSKHAKKTTSKCVPKTMPTTLPVKDEVIVIEESDDEVEILKTEQADTDVDEEKSTTDSDEKDNADDEDESDFGQEERDKLLAEGESTKPVDLSKRTNLMKLYPGTYDVHHKKANEMDDLSDEDDECDELDYVKKTIMVGAAYQAAIPTGLSKYGDVLPYENEDKLIWEPSQVSEREVEDFLLRVKEVKTPNVFTQEEDLLSSSTSVLSESDVGVGTSLVKDDEQVLHLLVQCGYNFKEALRRKRLYAIPLTGSMSLWSEEECRNFEEGVQKFGKDFRKIHQTLVKTRSIRELVQFYYLWKKTERRDMTFVDSDTIDIMDVYLDFDERDTGSNGGSKNTTSSLPNDHNPSGQAFPSKLHHRFSIMNEAKRSGGGAKLPIAKKSYRRRNGLFQQKSTQSGGTKKCRSANKSSTVASSSSALSKTTVTGNENQ